MCGKNHTEIVAVLWPRVTYGFISAYVVWPISNSVVCIRRTKRKPKNEVGRAAVFSEGLWTGDSTGITEQIKKKPNDCLHDFLRKRILDSMFYANCRVGSYLGHRKNPDELSSTQHAGNSTEWNFRTEKQNCAFVCRRKELAQYVPHDLVLPYNTNMSESEIGKCKKRIL